MPEFATDMPVTALAARDIRKTYGALVAVDDCDFTLEKGEIHVLLGTNGCGKSTLCKVVAGAVSADSGEIELHGKPASFSGPLAARDAGIATVYQELSLNPTQTVTENIFLGGEPAYRGHLDRKAMHQRTVDLIESLGELGSGLDPDALVGDLSIDRKQIVEIAKALVLKPSVVLFDESTSSLDLSQVKAFFSLVRNLQEQGCSIIFISHRMEEIFEIGDRVTVMRNGKCIDTVRLADTDRQSLVALMVGEAEATPVVPAKPATSRRAGEVVMALDGLENERLDPFSLKLRAGEIVGLGGLHGQGQSDLLLSIFGAATRPKSSISVAGNTLRPNSPTDALRAGLVYVSGDRGKEGALHGRPILENLALSRLVKRKGAMGWGLNPRTLRKLMTPIVERMRLKYSGYGAQIGSLSGGNQQKVVIGRGLAAEPRILLLDDPTKGIDIRAKTDLFDLIRELCADGVAVLLYSSEDAELLENADRILVFNSGAVTDSLSGARMTDFELYKAALKAAA